MAPLSPSCPQPRGRDLLLDNQGKEGSPPTARRRTHHLQKGQVPGPHVVKVDLHLGPVQFASHVERLTVALVVHDGIVQGQVSLGLVDASPKLPREEVHAHDAEDEPEDEADEEDVHDGWDGAHQGVNHNLKWAENRLSFWGCSECTPFVRCPPNLLNSLGVGPCGGTGGEHFLSTRKNSPWLEALVGSEREHTCLLLCIPHSHSSEPSVLSFIALPGIHDLQT